jgi:hypothetical protein
MEIIAFKSVGLLSFGDSRAAARQKLASTFSTFEKVAGETGTDSFDDLGLHLYYSDIEQLEFVEAFEPADVTFRGIRFLGRNLNEVTAQMKSIGYDGEQSDVGIKFSAAGIALTAPHGVVEGIAVHRKGYYD